MFTVQANHEAIREFYTAREAQDFARSYAKEHGVTTYIKTGEQQASKTKRPLDYTEEVLKALGELRDKQRTKAGAKAVDDAIAIVLPF